MPRYTVRHRYAAFRDGRQFGPWTEGAEIEVDTADAEWVNRDSPDTLVEVKPKAESKTPPRGGRASS